MQKRLPVTLINDHNYWTEFLPTLPTTKEQLPTSVPSSHGKVFKARFDAEAKV